MMYRIGDRLIDSRAGSYEYEITDVDLVRKRYKIQYRPRDSTQLWSDLNWFPEISIMSSLQPMIKRYDPSQQGDQDDDI